MTTVAQLIEYLQTLPPETTVDVAVGVDGSYASYTATEALELPKWIENDGDGYWDFSDNMDFYSGNNAPSILLGRT